MIHCLESGFGLWLISQFLLRRCFALSSPKSLNNKMLNVYVTAPTINGVSVLILPCFLLPS